MPPSTTRVLLASVLWRVVCVCLLLVSTHAQPAFDTSGELVRLTLRPGAWDAYWDAWAAPFVRWDTVYFVAMAERGYVYEQMLAFQPGIVHVLRVMGSVPRVWGAPWSPTCAVLGGAIAANLASILAPVLLYRLLRTLTRSDTVAERAALLSVLAPASGTSLSAPTPESFYSILALSGLLLLTHTHTAYQWGAAVCFALATWFRANGVLLCGFLVWHGLYKPVLESWPTRRRSHAISGIASALVSVSPFVAQQWWAYTRLCPGRPWCDARLPLAYTFVQRAYWDVGFLRYWTVAQVPNFVLAMPVLAVAAYACRPLVSSSVLVVLAPWRARQAPGDVYVYACHTLVLVCILLLASHVQIALRMATPGGMPLVWWACAALYERHRGVLVYLLCYSTAAIVLYAGFYPPA